MRVYVRVMFRERFEIKDQGDDVQERFESLGIRMMVLKKRFEFEDQGGGVFGEIRG